MHTPEYVAAFNSGSLDAASCRRIGFGACMADPKLIERTKAEVAGVVHICSHARSMKRGRGRVGVGEGQRLQSWGKSAHVPGFCTNIPGGEIKSVF